MITLSLQECKHFFKKILLIIKKLISKLNSTPIHPKVEVTLRNCLGGSYSDRKLYQQTVQYLFLDSEPELPFPLSLTRHRPAACPWHLKKAWHNPWCDGEPVHENLFLSSSPPLAVSTHAFSDVKVGVATPRFLPPFFCHTSLICLQIYS